MRIIFVFAQFFTLLANFFFNSTLEVKKNLHQNSLTFNQMRIDSTPIHTRKDVVKQKKAKTLVQCEKINTLYEICNNITQLKVG